jgi:hypothetical protein
MLQTIDSANAIVRSCHRMGCTVTGDAGFRDAEGVVRGVLIRFRDLRADLDGVGVVPFSRETIRRIRKDHDLPAGPKTWFLQVAGVLAALESHVHPRALYALAGRLVPREESPKAKPPGWGISAAEPEKELRQLIEIYVQAVWYVRHELEPFGPVPLTYHSSAPRARRTARTAS